MSQLKFSKKGMIAFAAVDALLIIFLLLPFIFGYIAENRINQIIKSVPPSSGMSLHLKSYQRGWFTSDAVLDVEVIDPALTHMGGQTHFPVQLAVTHGPVLFYKNLEQTTRVGFGQANLAARVDFPDELKNEVSKFSQNQPLLNANLEIGLMGGLNADMHTLQISWGEPSGMKAVWGGIQAHMSMGSDGKNFSLQGKVLPASVHLMPFFAFESKQIDISADSNKGLVWYGSGQITVPSIKLDFANNKQFSITGLDTQQSSSIDSDQRYSINVIYKLGQLVFVDRAIGPAEMDLSIGNISAIGLQQFQNKMNQVFEQATNPEQEKEAAASLLPDITNLVNQGLTIKISKFNVTMPEGQMSANLNFVISPEQQTAANLQTLLARSQMNLFVSMPVNLVNAILHHHMMNVVMNASQFHPDLQKMNPQQLQAVAEQQTQQQIQNWMQSGLLKMDKDSYTMKVDYQNQKLTVNDKEFQPSDLGNIIAS